MLFNSTEFLFLFLPCTLLVFFGLARWSPRAALGSLMMASLFFYSWWEWRFLPVLLISVVFNFSIGRQLAKARPDKDTLVKDTSTKNTPANNSAYKKALLTVAVSANLCALFFYKYIDFVIGNFNAAFGTDVGLTQVELPLGISFFTFTQIAFLVDTYRNKASEPNPVNYTLFVNYFPHLIAGPILHHAQMMPQFRNASIYTPRAENFVIGLTFLTIGLVKKVLIADYIAKYATPVFNAGTEGQALGFYEAWVGALAYSLQLYFDFSGYCDMAIGISRMFNIDLPLNFASPYQSINIIEFWRRWHMTLSQFLRDYLYIPLGGNRNGKGRRYLNLFITMLLGGLWHGANWTFVVWGALHGSYLIINHGFHALREKFGLPSIPKPIAIVITLIAVVFAWVPFRADSMTTAFAMWQAMLTLPEANTALVSTSDIPVVKAARIILLWMLVVLLAPNSQTLAARLQQHLVSHHRPLPLGWIIPGVAAGALFAITVMSLGHVSEFLYFQF